MAFIRASQPAAAACFDKYCMQECSAVLDEKIGGLPVAANEKTGELQVPAQDPVLKVLGGAVALVSADFDPTCYAACCIISGSSAANFGILDSAWEWVKMQEGCKRAAASFPYLCTSSARFGTVGRATQC